MSRSTDLASKLIFETLKLLKENGGTLSSKALKEMIPQRVDLDEWAKSTCGKDNAIRWINVFQFYSDNLSKAKFIRKEKGIWSITPEGKKVISKGEKAVFEISRQKYCEWDDAKKANISSNNDRSCCIKQNKKTLLFKLREACATFLRNLANRISVN